MNLLRSFWNWFCVTALQRQDVLVFLHGYSIENFPSGVRQPHAVLVMLQTWPWLRTREVDWCDEKLHVWIETAIETTSFATKRRSRFVTSVGYHLPPHHRLLIKTRRGFQTNVFVRPLFDTRDQTLLVSFKD